ncbi:hypothetical protein MKW94_016993 [Papaver nudicaule]|uniref:RING-type domain-containing protein n=1 Tax=Papaver nudicaule TaxID=74823 RepID=A0AA41VRJ7_PAPNU|nr:hypothetical protein [Papaver nudicaule]
MVFSPFVMAPFITPSSKIPSSIQLIIYIASSIVNSIFLNLKRILSEDKSEEDRDLEADHDLYTSDVVAELIRRVTTVSNFEDLISDTCATYYEEDSCIVCLCQFQRKDEIRQLNTCEHIFHRSCLDRWIHHGQVLCPLCRTPFLTMKRNSLAYIRN